MLFIVLCIIGIIVGLLLLKFWDWFYIDLEFLGMLIIGLFGTGLAIVLFAFLIENVGKDGEYMANKQLYESLQYKVECGEMRDEFGIVNKEYVDEIQEWNIDLVKYKTYHDSPWFNLFYPNDYSEFEVIDLNKINY